MYLLKLTVFCLIIYICNGKEEDVLELTDNDFESRLAEYETALVMFYAPWYVFLKKLFY